MQTLTTVEEVVTALGGTQKAADLTGRSKQAVANWKARGGLPTSTYVVITRHLATLGKSALLDLWGMEDS